MDRDRRTAYLCAAVALAASLLALGFTLSIQDWKPSALVRMQQDEAMARYVLEDDPGFAFVPPGGHYDGVYAYGIARDPMALGEAHELMDHSAYRYGRAGLGWAAFVLSAGRPLAVPWALMLLGIGGIVVGSFVTSRLAVALGLPALGGLVVALNPGVIYGVTADTSEPLTAAVAAGGILLWLRGRLLPAALLMAFLCLIKEPFAAVPAGMAAWEIKRRAAGTGAEDFRRRLTLLVATGIPLLLWWIYVWVVFGEWPFNQPWLIEAPLAGWADTMRQAASMGLSGFLEIQIGTMMLPLLVAVALFFIVAIVKAVRLRTPLDPMFLGMMAVFSVLSWWQLLYPKEMFRILAIPLAFALAILASARRPSPRV